MADQQPSSNVDEKTEGRRRRARIWAFVLGFVVALSVFTFFPGMPHVVDMGSLVGALAVGGLTDWACRWWMARNAARETR